MRCLYLKRSESVPTRPHFFFFFQAEDGIRDLTVTGVQTCALPICNKMAPFNNAAVRQAFAYATDKETLALAIFKGAAIPAPTIIPPGMPGYQPNYQGQIGRASCRERV